jgi:hypothetical protein
MIVGQYKRIWLFLAVLMLSALPVTLEADPGSLSPEQVKAGYLIKIRAYAQVGNPPHVVKQICYYEEAGVPENESVGQILAKYLQQKNIQDISVKQYKAIQNFSGCDMLYIPATAAASIEDMLSKVDSLPILTISSAERFIFHGGMIGFVMDDANHVRMEGNLLNMKKNDISIDAGLLAIMQQVIRQ